MTHGCFEIFGFLLLLFLFFDVSLDELGLCLVSDVFDEHNMHSLAVPYGFSDLNSKEDLLCKLTERLFLSFATCRID